MVTIIIYRSNLMKKTEQTGNKGTKYVESMVSLKYPSIFWRTLEVPLINCDISSMLTWTKNSILVASFVTNQEPTLTITDIKLYVSVITLSTLSTRKIIETIRIRIQKNNSLE